MKTQITKTMTLAIAVIAGLVASTNQANAQCSASPQILVQPQPYVQPQIVVQPQPYVQPQVAPVPLNQFYFGVDIELRQCHLNGTVLRIVGITPGSPAHRAGLEIGDEIHRLNGRRFEGAVDSFDAVRLMNLYVAAGSGSAPAVAGQAQALVIGPPAPGPPVARMIVRNVRSGRNVSLTVYPTRVGGGAPVAAATVAGG